MTSSVHLVFSLNKVRFESWIILLINENLCNTEKHKSKIMHWHWFNSLCTNDSWVSLYSCSNIHHHTTELSKQIQTFSTSPYPFKIIFKNLMLQYTTTFINIKTFTHSCQSINIFTRDIVFYYCANSVKLFYFDYILL